MARIEQTIFEEHNRRVALHNALLGTDVRNYDKIIGLATEFLQIDGGTLERKILLALCLKAQESIKTSE